MSSAINWDDGRLLRLKFGESATCGGLIDDQVYAFVFYNANPDNIECGVNILWPGNPPDLHLPGSTADETGCNQAVGAVVLVHGGDAGAFTIGVSEDGSNEASVECWACSLSLPTRTSGITNIRLSDHGQVEKLGRCTRSYAMLKSLQRVRVSTYRKIPFTVIRFRKGSARAALFNHRGFECENLVYRLGRAEEDRIVRVENKDQTDIQILDPESGEQFVWMSSASGQSSNGVEICLESV